ncbi:hypothetical protein HUG10_10520 [Halorarum halophilum]|uniref:Uncharacterized protein n=1 Tax=Halorarum halophilum TaxID=2743090 RepID=A0A7D5L2T2_9EURY|nr:hypothetical protein [Halobaculum halophilum]QLG27963.1 hypothetical protein HUG10_10520 [Halobaculum halophilum]
MGRRRTFAALTLVCHALLAGFVVRDARQRDRDARLWGLVTLGTGVIGALAYRATR